jgi:hypothetical protein
LIAGEILRRSLFILVAIVLVGGCSEEGVKRPFLFDVTSVAGDLGSARTPVVFYDGYYLQVVWSEDRGLGPDLYIQSFDSDGRPVGHSRRITESRWSRRPVVQQIEDAFVIAWTDRVNGMQEVMAAGLNPRGGELLSAVNVSSDDQRPSHSPRLTEHGGKPVLVYKERLADVLSSVHRMNIVVLDLQGQPDGEPQPFWEIGLAPYNPAVATSGRTLMIASNTFSSGKWSLGFSQIASLKILPEQPDPIESEANLWAPSIAPIGDNFLVAYRNNGGVVPRIDIARVYYDEDDELVSEITNASQGDDFVSGPTIATRGDSVVVLFRAERSGNHYLVGIPVRSNYVLGQMETLEEGIGLGDPVSAVLVGGSLCVAWETLVEGRGSVQVGCFGAPGGGW